MVRCRKHKRKVYKIERLYPTFEFDERLAFSSCCEYCEDFLLTLVFIREDGSRWTHKYGKWQAVEKYEELQHEIMCEYKDSSVLSPELDIGHTYLEGKDFTIRKLRNSAIVENYYPPELINEILIFLVINLYIQQTKYFPSLFLTQKQGRTIL